MLGELAEDVAVDRRAGMGSLDLEADRLRLLRED
jgi:hypothetical protein